MEPPFETSKRHTPWFVWLMCGFAMTVVASLIYGFASLAGGGVPKVEVEQPEPPSLPAAPASPAPSPAAPDAQ